MKNLLRFLCWSFYRLFLYREVLPFYIWFYPLLLDYDVSLHNLVVLVVVIPTSPRTSKTEFVFKRYLRFRIDGFPVFPGAEVPGKVPNLVPLNHISSRVSSFHKRNFVREFRVKFRWCGTSARNCGTSDSARKLANGQISHIPT